MVDICAALKHYSCMWPEWFPGPQRRHGFQLGCQFWFSVAAPPPPQKKLCLARSWGGLEVNEKGCLDWLTCLLWEDSVVYWFQIYDLLVTASTSYGVKVYTHWTTYKGETLLSELWSSLCLQNISLLIK